MASRQAAKEEGAEAAARNAADELSDVNRERKQREQEGKMENETQYHHEQRGPGVIGSIIKSVQGTVEHAKDAVMGKSQESTEKMEEYKDSAARKTGEYKDYTAEKAEEAAEKVKETEDSAAEKAKRSTDRCRKEGKGE